MRLQGLAVVVLLTGCQHHVDKTAVALIDGSPIYASELKKELRRQRLEEDAPIDAQKRALLDDMIERRLLAHEVEKANVFVSSDEVETLFTKMRAGWQEEEFNAQLTARDMTPAELKTELRESLAIRKYFRDQVFARLAVTDAEIDGYLQEHPDLLANSDEIRLRQILVKTQDQARLVLAEIKKGLPFEDAAQRYSIAPEAKLGGDLGYMSRGSMPKVLEEKCFALEPGKMSDGVQSELGFHIFMMMDRRASAVNPRERAEAIMREDKEQRARVAKVKELREAHKVVIKENKLVQVD